MRLQASSPWPQLMRQQGHLLITSLLEIVLCSAGMVSCALNGRDQPILHAGNYGNLPLVLVPSLLRDSTIFDGVSQETAFSYVVIGLFVSSIAQFSLAFQLLKLPPTAVAAANSVAPLAALPPAVTPKSGMQRSKHGTPRAGEPLDGVDAPDCSPTCCECKHRVCECRVLEGAAPGDADLELATCSESSNERACSARAHAAVCGTCGLHGGAHPRSHAEGCSAASCPGCAPQCCCDWGRRSTHACAVQLPSEHSARERRAGDTVGAADAEKAAERKFAEVSCMHESWTRVILDFFADFRGPLQNPIPIAHVAQNQLQLNTPADPAGCKHNTKPSSDVSSRAHFL